MTPHVSELLSCLDDGCMAKILDFECLDKEIRQSLNYVDIHKWEWNEAEMIKYYLDKDLEGEENQIDAVLLLLKECFCEMKIREMGNGRE